MMLEKRNDIVTKTNKVISIDISEYLLTQQQKSTGSVNRLIDTFDLIDEIPAPQSFRELIAFNRKVDLIIYQSFSERLS